MTWDEDDVGALLAHPSRQPTSEGLKIAYIGNFVPTHSTETHIAYSLEALGHQVLRVQEDRLSLEARIALVDDWQPELVLWTRTWANVWTPIERTIQWFRQLEERGIPSVSFHLDLYAGLDRAKTVAWDPFWKTTMVFTADGGSSEFFESQGVKHYWCPPCVFDVECHLVPTRKLTHDVLFVGSGDLAGNHYHDAWTWRMEMLRFLNQRYGSRFVKWGLPGLNGGGNSIRNVDLNQLLSQAAVVVGDTLCLGPGAAPEPRFKHTYYWSDRITETTGRGGLIVHPRIEGLKGYFIYGQEIETFEYGDLEGLGKVIDALVADPERALALRRAGHLRTKMEHTYLHRCAETLVQVGDLYPSIQKKLREMPSRRISTSPSLEERWVYNHQPWTGEVHLGKVKE